HRLPAWSALRTRRPWCRFYGPCPCCGLGVAERAIVLGPGPGTWPGRTVRARELRWCPRVRFGTGRVAVPATASGLTRDAAQVSCLHAQYVVWRAGFPLSAAPS